MMSRELLRYPEQLAAYLRQLESRIAKLEREQRKRKAGE